MLRRYVVWIAALAAIILIWLQLPADWPIAQPEPGGTLNLTLTWIFWILSIVIVLTLFTDRRDPEATVVEVEGPAFARYLFSNTRAGLFWLPIRIFLGLSWFEAGFHKFQGPGWLDGGASLRGFWMGAVSIPDQGRPPISYDWYRDFINVLLNGHHEGWFAYVITFGEMAVGIGLIVGALTAASSNPVLFTGAVGLMLAWRVAGYYGVDRYLLPMLGTPWRAPVRTGTGPAGSTS
jgi:thiosulfate dehydrogenase [quinone] large subunit